MSKRFGIKLVMMVMVIALGVAAADNAGANDAATPLNGVWQRHEFSFAFMGFTSTYSCDGLADKLKLLLIAAGARHDVKATPGACSRGFGRPDIFARAELTFYTLTAPQPGKAADAAPVIGEWRPVMFAQRQPRELGLGDCELVQQFKDQLLPIFTTRNVVDQSTCVPHQLSGSRVDLSFESFTAGTSPVNARSR